MKNTTSFTRGHGLLEDFLSKKRAQKANSLIDYSYRDGTILDIGCGFYPYFLVNTSFKEKYGLDPSLNAFNLKNIKLIKFNVSNSPLPFKNNFFDVITMLAVFEHIEKEKLNLVLKEILRVLKTNGVLIITTPSPWSDRLLHQMSKFGLISEVEIHEHKSHYNKQSIINIIKNAGFKSEKIKGGYFELGLNMWLTATK